jgi:hypothetical protein
MVRLLRPLQRKRVRRICKSLRWLGASCAIGWRPLARTAKSRFPSPCSTGHHPALQLCFSPRYRSFRSKPSEIKGCRSTPLDLVRLRDRKLVLARATGRTHPSTEERISCSVCMEPTEFPLRSASNALSRSLPVSLPQVPLGNVINPGV